MMYNHLNVKIVDQAYFYVHGSCSPSICTTINLQQHRQFAKTIRIFMFNEWQCEIHQLDNEAGDRKRSF